MAGKFKRAKKFQERKSKPLKTKETVEQNNSSGSEDSDEDLQFAVNISDIQSKEFENDKIGENEDNGEESFDDDESGDEDVAETLENENFDEASHKRKHPETSNGADATPSKKRKKNKASADLQKPPSAQEVARLRETENLFHSSLFRLQIDEMLNELAIKKKRVNSFTEWFSSFKQSLTEVKPGKQHELMDQTWLKKLGVSMPLIQSPLALKGVYEFLPPTSVSIIGSYASGVSLGPHLNVDVAIEMPSKCFQGSDHLNHRYHRKRALYLCQIVSHLKKSGIISLVDEFSPRFEIPRAANPLVPVAVIVPAGALQGHAHVCLHVTVPEETFKFSKFGPSKNSVRAKWYFNEEDAEKEINSATPQNNATILADLVAMRNETLKQETLKDFKSLKDGIILLKVWLRQRELDQGFSAFGSHLMTMLVIYLIQNRKISSQMSSYQVARTTWNFLKESDWTRLGGGLTLCDKPAPGSPTLSEFHENYEVVFVDRTGYCNLAAHLNSVSFRRIRVESTLAIQCLDNPSINSFQVLFMKPAPFYRRYDHVLCFYNLELLHQMNDAKASREDILDKGQHPTMLTASLLLNILQKGLGKRVSEWGIHVPNRASWKVGDDPIPSLGPILIGMNLDSEHAYSILDKGPPADKPEAEEFRKFWGEKSELRRFQDGSISEAVVWLSEKDVTLSQRRIVNGIIVEYLLGKKLELNPKKCFVYLATQLEEILSLPQVKPSSFSYGTGEEATLAVLSALDRLSSELRSLSDLPLDISGVQGSSPVCRFTDAFPPLSTVHYAGKKITKPGEKSILLRTGHRSSMAPVYIPPVEVVLQLALSGKWPDDTQAIRRVRAAFSIKIAECLKTQCGLVAQAFPNHVDVLKDGFVFRLRVAYQREPALLRQCVMPDGMVKIVDCKEALILEKETNQLPKLTSFLHGLHQQQPAFGPAVCLAKRWMSAHMIRWTHFPEEAVELLMSHIFTSPEPYFPPAQPQTAFLRFLHLLSSTNWHLDPLIVNFNNEMSRDTVIEIERRFMSERGQLPALFIATPSERESSLWTREAPSLTILARVALLAAESLKVLQAVYFTSVSLETKSWKQIFRPSLDAFNLVIHLIPAMNPRRSQWIDAKVDSEVRVLEPYKKTKGEKVPVTGYDPVQCYLQELEASYSEYALFFHDIFGGGSIGVVWKPQAFEAKDFKVTHVNGRKLVDNSKASPQLIVNKEALIEDFYVLGHGLVSSIDVRDRSI